MKYTLIAALTTLITAIPAFGAELYHCTVNNVSDGYFNPIDLKIDDDQITGESTVQGKAAEIGGDLIAFHYTANEQVYTAIIYRDGQGLTEGISFALPEVVGKLGPGNRYTAKNGSGAINRSVSMICEMATPI
jgi:hypothetical protein